MAQLSDSPQTSQIVGAAHINYKSAQIHKCSWKTSSTSTKGSACALTSKEDLKKKQIELNGI